MRAPLEELFVGSQRKAIDILSKRDLETAEDRVLEDATIFLCCLDADSEGARTFVGPMRPKVFSSCYQVLVFPRICRGDRHASVDFTRCKSASLYDEYTE